MEKTQIYDIAKRLRSCNEAMGDSLFVNCYIEAFRKYRDNLELVTKEVEKVRDEHALKTLKNQAAPQALEEIVK